MIRQSLVEETLKSTGFFPRAASLWKKGQPVYEFPFIQVLSTDRYVVHLQRHHALNSFELAEKMKWEYASLDSAIRKWQNLEDGEF